MKEVPLVGRARSEHGKGPARRARMTGDIPAVVYGPEIETRTVVVSEHEFHAAMKTARGAAVLNLDIDGDQSQVVVRDVQRDPLTSRITHLDFYAISMNKPLHIAVPLRMTGIPRGVKTDGGIMQTTLREIEILGLPANIPDEIEIDVTDLGIGDSIHVADLDISDVDVLTDVDRTVVVISAPTVIKAAATAEEEGEEGLEAAEGEEAEGEEGAAEGEGEQEEGKKEKE